MLFFPPMAGPGGGTQEACRFRDLAGEFAALGAQPVGISSDNVTKQSVSASAHSLGYPLLAAPTTRSRRNSGAYRAWLPGGLHTRRRTYVIGRDRRIVAEFASESTSDEHADEALEALEAPRMRTDVPAG